MGGVISVLRIFSKRNFPMNAKAASIRVSATGEGAGSAFDLALRGETEGIRLLAERTPNLYGHKDGAGRYLSHWACSGGHAELLALVLEQGCPLDEADDSGWTPLMLSAAVGSLTCLRLLLGKGAESAAKRNGGHSALQTAASKGKLEIVDLLIANGADVNSADDRGSTPLHRAASQGHDKVVATLLKSEELNVNVPDKEGNTALHLACEEGRENSCRLLMQKGARTDVVNKDEKTPGDLGPACMKRASMGV